MGIFGDLVNSILGGDSNDSSQAVHPCSNCPSNCQIAPTACSVCQPYKEQMIDAIYNVEHMEEIISRYEVAGTSASAGAVTCPHCGGASDNHYVCDFCGSTLQEGSGKIQVASAADIPNPVLAAQDIIFARYDAVKNIAGDGYGLGEALSGIGSEGLFSSVLGALIGADPNDNKSIGQKMTEDEIYEMAEKYGVSVSAYLTGLDNGKYLTMSNKSLYDETARHYSTQSSSSSLGLGSIAGIAGMAGLGTAGLGSIFGLRSNSRDSYSQRNGNYHEYGRPGQTDHAHHSHSNQADRNTFSGFTGHSSHSEGNHQFHMAPPEGSGFGSHSSHPGGSGMGHHRHDSSVQQSRTTETRSGERSSRGAGNASGSKKSGTPHKTTGAKSSPSSGRTQGASHRPGGPDMGHRPGR